MEAEGSPAPVTFYRRPWFVIGLFTLAACGLMAWLVVADSPPPDDSDMIPTWSDRGGDKNPLAVFCRDIQSVAYQEIPPILTNEAVSGKTDEEEVARLLARHSAALASFDSLISTNPATWQWPDDHDHLAPKQMAYVSGCLAMVNLLRWKARLHTSKGETAKAVEVCLALIQFGYGMQQAEGGLFPLIMSCSDQASGEQLLRKVLDMRGATPELIRQCLDKLSGCDPSSARNLIFAIKLQYFELRHMVTTPEGSAFLLEQAFASLMPGHQPTLLYKPNRTLALLHQHYREMMEACHAGWPALAAFLEASTARIEKLESESGTWRFKIDPNLGGKLTAMREIKNLNIGVRKCFNLQGAHHQIRLILALRLYELEHGRLPESLTELTPKYLAEVPMDLYTGAPMRWNAASGVVYSVGSDLKDDRGQIDHKGWRRPKDRGMMYWWRAGSAAGAP